MIGAPLLRHGRQATAGTGARPLARSPLHLFTFVVGMVVTVVGWGLATLFDDTFIAFTAELAELMSRLPPWSDAAPRAAATVGAVGAVVLVHIWMLRQRRIRGLALGYLGMATALGASAGAGMFLHSVLEPDVRALFDLAASGSARRSVTDPVVAAVVALVVLNGRSLPIRTRHTVVLLAPIWLSANAVVDPGVPYLGLVLDVGVGTVCAAVVALVARTPCERPGPDAITAGLAGVGLPGCSLVPAAVDARGSVPWFATTPAGRRLFVKALSREQRVADLMFRALRWLRLRRTGDAPPETSLRRSAEHEAFVSHHVRQLGVPTPVLVAVADLGDDDVALVYDAVSGRSFDKIRPTEMTDGLLRQVWSHVARLRDNGVAHRDLRLANVFLADDGTTMLIDFGFGELAASRQLLDTDVAELLVASATVVGPERAVRTAGDVLGRDVLTLAAEWLHPLVLTTATRRAIRGTDTLQVLRDDLLAEERIASLEHESFARLSPERMLSGALLAVASYSLIVVLADETIRGSIGAIDWSLAVGALALSTLAYPLGALSYRAATVGRAPLRAALPAILRGHLPMPAPTPWSWAARCLSETARAVGLTPTATQRATATWVAVGVAVAPVLVAGFSAAALRVSHGYASGIAAGALIGAAVALVQLTLLRATPWGQHLGHLWLRDPPNHRSGGTDLAAVFGWWTAVNVVHSTAVVLAARSVDVPTTVEALVAIAIAAHAIAMLTPSSGGLGAVEVLLFLGLVMGTDAESAILAVIVARMATFWLHLPAALVAQRFHHGDDDRSRP